MPVCLEISRERADRICSRHHDQPFVLIGRHVPQKQLRSTISYPPRGLRRTAAYRSSVTCPDGSGFRPSKEKPAASPECD